jgi:ABC-type nitrate/sulfonate/bicarbonate transport system substrate-binding protein
MMKRISSLVILTGMLFSAYTSHAADRVRFAFPAKSLNYLPMTLGRDKGMFHAEGIELQMILVSSTIQVTALTTGDIDFSGAQSQVMAGAARGLPVRSWVFRPSSPPFG